MLFTTALLNGAQQKEGKLIFIIANWAICDTSDTELFSQIVSVSSSINLQILSIFEQSEHMVFSICS